MSPKKRKTVDADQTARHLMNLRGGRAPGKSATTADAESKNADDKTKNSANRPRRTSHGTPSSAGHHNIAPDANAGAGADDDDGESMDLPQEEYDDEDMGQDDDEENETDVDYDPEEVKKKPRYDQKEKPLPTTASATTLSKAYTSGHKMYLRAGGDPFFQPPLATIDLAPGAHVVSYTGTVGARIPYQPRAFLSFLRPMYVHAALSLCLILF